jgi:hypothetical protein
MLQIQFGIPWIEHQSNSQSADDENADDSPGLNHEVDSNVIDESDLQTEKHFDPRISTLPGL